MENFVNFIHFFIHFSLFMGFKNDETIVFPLKPSTITHKIKLESSRSTEIFSYTAFVSCR